MSSNVSFAKVKDTIAAHTNVVQSLVPRLNPKQLVVEIAGIERYFPIVNGEISHKLVMKIANRLNINPKHFWDT
jgi:hypothetical protein